MAMEYQIWILVLAGVAVAQNVKLGDWTQLDSDGGLDIFAKTDRAFDTSINEDYCSKGEITVPLTSECVDYTPRFHEAMANLIAANGGGTLKLMAGTYITASPIYIPSYICIKGAGMDETTIQMKDFADDFPKSGCLRSFHSERITLMDFTQDGNRANQHDATPENKYGRYGYFHELTNFVWIKNVLIKNNYGYGFDPHGDKKYWSYYLIIEYCEAVNNGYDGFTIDQSQFVSLLHNKASDNARHGVNIVTGTRYLLMKSLSVKENGKTSGTGCGVTIQNNQNFSTHSIILKDSAMTSNVRAGVCMKDVFTIKIQSNTISHPQVAAPCYSMKNCSDVVLTANTCETHPGVEIANDDLTVYTALSENNIGNPDNYFVGSIADPNCNTGVSTPKVCCPKNCGVCSGIGCGLRQPGGVCCQSNIIALMRSCLNKGPPCRFSTFSETTSSEADPGCLRGTYAKGFCCPNSCNECGGANCRDKKNGGACCTATIADSGRKCDEVGAPCEMADASEPDPNCLRGTSNGNVCCSRKCKACGTECGSGPDVDPSSCCESTVLRKGVSCTTAGGPCILPHVTPVSLKSKQSFSRKKQAPFDSSSNISAGKCEADGSCDSNLDSPDPLCESGILDELSAVCCPKLCGKCRNLPRYYRYYKWFKLCDAATIKESARRCTSVGSPCRMSES